MAKKNLTYSDQIKKLELIVEKMEDGDISLEESMKMYVEGMTLALACEKMLSEAESQIILLQKNSDATGVETVQSKD